VYKVKENKNENRFFCSPKKHSASSKITLSHPIKHWLVSEYNELHTTYGVNLP
jgi:hypothetical protein